MFLSKILGLENSFSKSILYVMLTTSAYMLFGAFAYVVLVGFPMLCMKAENIVN